MNELAEPKPQENASYADDEKFRDLPRLVVSAKAFIEIAQREGWHGKTAPMLLRGGHTRPLKCGEAIYKVIA